MMDKNSIGALGLVHDEYRVKAAIKYQILQLESRLNQCTALWEEDDVMTESFISLSESLARKYLDYAQFSENNRKHTCSDLPRPSLLGDWRKQRDTISHLKESALKAKNKNDEAKILIEIASYYYHLEMQVNSSEEGA